MPEWNCDSELFNLSKTELYAPVVGEILDQLKYYHRFLPQRFQPMRKSDTVAGRAMPALMIDVFGNLDGVLVIPKKIEEEVVTKALEK